MTDDRDDKERGFPALAVFILVVFAFLFGLAIGHPVTSCAPYHPDHIAGFTGRTKETRL